MAIREPKSAKALLNSPLSLYLWTDYNDTLVMKILLTRDSVCAGDDADAPHSRLLSIDDDCSVAQLLEAIRLEGLPAIAGGHASWVASSAKPLGVLAQQWLESRTIWGMSYGTVMSRTKELDWSDSCLRVHLSYLAQIDPELVLSVVERLRLKP